MTVHDITVEIGTLIPAWASTRFLLLASDSARWTEDEIGNLLSPIMRQRTLTICKTTRIVTPDDATLGKLASHRPNPETRAHAFIKWPALQERVDQEDVTTFQGRTFVSGWARVQPGSFSQVLPALTGIVNSSEFAKSGMWILATPPQNDFTTESSAAVRQFCLTIARSRSRPVASEEDARALRFSVQGALEQLGRALIAQRASIVLSALDVDLRVF